MNVKQIRISNMSVMAHLHEKSEDHKNVCDSNSYEAEICTECFLNKSQVCCVILVKYDIHTSITSECASCNHSSTKTGTSAS